MMTITEIYEFVPVLIPAWLLALLALGVALGWAWRLTQYVPHTPPTIYKSLALVGWALASLFYGLIWANAITQAMAVALVRIVWLLLMSNEVTAHLYVYKVCRIWKDCNQP